MNESVSTSTSTASRLSKLLQRHDLIVAAIAITGIAVHLVMRWGFGTSEAARNIPLLIVLALGGTAVLIELSIKLLRGEWGADLLAGISIVASVLLDEYLAGALVVLMLSGGEAIESMAMERAKSVLSALAKRMPTVAHRRRQGEVVDIPVADIEIGDDIVVLPHDICPVDGVVTEGHGGMDESFLTGEPYQVSKAPGTTVISGALNGQAVLAIRATKRAIDSRYAQIMKVMQDSQQRRPAMRRLGDTLGAWYTPLALTIAFIAWYFTGEASRFLAVLVIATPCPLLIGIPVAILGAISLAARNGIIVKNPAVLEQVVGCKAIIFDKTGTLTYGKPALTEILVADGVDARATLAMVASAEQYSKHPLAQAVLDQAASLGLALPEAHSVREAPGAGLEANVNGSTILVTHRKEAARRDPEGVRAIPPVASGLECVIVINGRYAATIRFRDRPRKDGVSFIKHLAGKHGIERVLIISGDRQQEVADLAGQLGIQEIHAEQTPEQKLNLVEEITARTRSIYVGDGINDAPALHAATVGIAFGQASDITAEAADAVIMDSSLRRVDQFLHISRRMRSIALQSAVGGMGLSVIGMLLASAGWLPPVAGAVLQEGIDIAAVLNAVRVAWPPNKLSDF